MIRSLLVLLLLVPGASALSGELIPLDLGAQSRTMAASNPPAPASTQAATVTAPEVGTSATWPYVVGAAIVSAGLLGILVMSIALARREDRAIRLLGLDAARWATHSRGERARAMRFARAIASNRAQRK